MSFRNLIKNLLGQEPNDMPKSTSKKRSSLTATPKAKALSKPRKTVSAKAKTKSKVASKKGTAIKPAFVRSLAKKSPAKAKAKTASTTKKSPIKMTKTKTKKATAKVVTSPIRYLVIATGPRVFMTNDGQELSNLVELHKAIQSMADEIFHYHANGEFNHFASWIEDVLEDADCAEKLRKAATKAKAATTLKRHLKMYVL